MFRKTPLAWLQVTREKTRLAVAIAGIAFADILIFVQLGFKMHYSILPLSRTKVYRQI